jgi:transposase-like protein
MKKISYKGYRFPLEIIQQAIWLYVRFTLYKSRRQSVPLNRLCAAV